MTHVFRIGTTLVLAAVSAGSFVLAQSRDVPDGRIAAKGVATRYVTADVLEIEFEISTEAASFTAAKAAADDLQRRLEAVLALEDLGTVSLDYDFGLLKQQGMYFKKGSKVEHRITATLRNPRLQSLHASLAAAMDRSLGLDQRLTVQDVRSRVSEEKTAAIEQDLLEEAVKDARANAEVIANAAGLRLVGPVSIYSTPVPRGPFEMTESVSVSSSVGMLHVREGFRLDGSLAPTVKMSVSITGVFAASPP